MEDKFFKPIAFKIDDEIELQSLNDDIYNQFAMSTAKLIDVDFAKTPVVDLFTGYQRCFVLEKENQELKDKIDKAVEILKLCNSECSREAIKVLEGDIE